VSIIQGGNTETPSRDLWVYIETTHDSAPRNVGLELLNPGRRLADQQKGSLVAIVIAADAGQAAQEAGAYGADRVIFIEGAEFGHYSTEAHTAAFAFLAEKYKPQTILIGATGNGRDLAPRLSARLRTGLTADCTQLDIDEASGNVSWTRPAFGGNLMAVILCPTHRPQMGTVRPGVFKKPARRENHAEPVRESFSFDSDLIRTRVVEVITEVNEKVDLEGAEIIVSGGRGLGDVRGFDIIRSFADSLGAVTGASRAAVEAGWIPHAHQVGQTGKSVAPRVYIACGISGAAQHIAGMGSSETISLSIKTQTPLSSRLRTTASSAMFLPSYPYWQRS